MTVQRLEALTPQERLVLKERAKQLAERPRSEGEDAAGDGVDLVEIQSRGQVFALPMLSVEGITELSSVAAVPRAHPIIRGLVSFRGEVLFGIELASLVGGATSGIADLRRVIAIATPGGKLAILAERVVSVRAGSLSSFKPDPLSNVPYVVGTDERFVVLLDPVQVVTEVFRTIRGESR